MNCEKCKIKIDGTYGSGRFCGRACANSRKWTSNDKLKKSKAAKTSKKVRKMALTNKKRFCKVCPICTNIFEVCKSGLIRTYCSKICYLADSDLKYRGNGQGGLREGSGRGKKGRYQGYYCDSSYELAWIVYHLDHKISFKRNIKGFPYLYEGKKRIYYPDFYLEKDQKYIEIKGYNTKQFQAKLDAFPEKINVLYLKDLKPFINYVKNIYGKNFVNILYGKVESMKQCQICNKPAKKYFCSRKCAGYARALSNNDPSRI